MDPLEKYTLLETMSMSELYEKTYKPKSPVIDGFLYQGAYLFVGAPKLGKSFFMLQLAYHVSTGTDLWSFPVNQGEVLYLALEDDHRRLQDRLYRMCGTNATPHLYITTEAKPFGYGLLEQIQLFINDHPKLSMVIIDTLQMVRDDISDNYSYSKDYDIIREMKAFASENGICLLLVHHTRKQQADDKFDMISGTNGLMGAADGAFILHKDKRTGANAVIEVSGRDQPDQKLYLIRDLDTLAWKLERVDVDYHAPRPEPLLDAVARFITPDNPDWCGTATELAAVLNVDIPPNTLSTKLNVNSGRLMSEYSIAYANTRNHEGRKIMLHLSRDGRDGRDGL